MTSSSVTAILLMLGFFGVVLDRVADTRGWSRSSKTLRRENEDLVRRNTELEATVLRLEENAVYHKSEIHRLNTLNDQLKLQDQKAVLNALELHEVTAQRRTEITSGLLVEIRDALIQNGGTA